MSPLKPKILLTGASGFIGTNFVLNLHKKYEITALVRKNSNVSKIETLCEIYRYDNDKKLTKFIQNKNFSGVVHLAALNQEVENLKLLESIVESNILFGAKIAQLALQNGLSFFINTASFYEYANSIYYNPLNIYAATKQAFYNLCKFYSNVGKTTFSHLLLYDNYGNNDNRVKLFNLWAKIAKSGEVLGMSKGEQKIDISHISDVISGFDILIELHLSGKAKNNQIYTLENTRYTLKELAKIFENSANVKLNIQWGAREYRKNEILEPITHKSCKSVEILPNWKPKITLKKGINMLINAKNNGGGGQNKFNATSFKCIRVA